MPPGAIVEGGDQDPLVEVACGTRDGQRSKKSEHARAAADLGRAGGTTLDVGRKTSGINGQEVIEQERVDEFSGVRAVQGVRVRHITYMTRARQKVAETLRA
jgi:hypothetical protein